MQEQENALRHVLYNHYENVFVPQGLVTFDLCSHILIRPIHKLASSVN
jgi:hypothetical protein